MKGVNVIIPQSKSKILYNNQSNILQTNSFFHLFGADKMFQIWSL